jgi:hypothetical protein
MITAEILGMTSPAFFIIFIPREEDENGKTPVLTVSVSGHSALCRTSGMDQ